MHTYHAARVVHSGGKRFSLGTNHHVIEARTNREKVWSRYAGCYVITGTGTYTDWEGRVESVGPGSFVHHFPEKYHHIERPPEGWEEYALFMDAALYSRYRDLGLIDDRRGVVQLGLDRSLSRAFEQLASEIETSAAEAEAGLVLSVGSLLLRILEQADGSRSRSPEETLIEEARRRLHRDLRAETDLQSLARESGISYPYFRRLFREYVGMSPAAYRNRQRMDHARLLLTNPRARVADVATALGYADPFIFSRQFKKVVGIPPKQYAQRHRLGD